MALPADAPAQSSVDESSAKLVCVARIGAAHGTRGEVRLWSFTAEPESVAAYGPLRTADGTMLEIVALRPVKNYFVARFKGVIDRTAAERLRNLELFVPRHRLPPASAEEFYHADLIGLAAEDLAGNAVGAVVAVHNFGAGDLLEVIPCTGDDGAHHSLLIPFTTSYVPQVHIAAGRIVIAPPHGLLEADSVLSLPSSDQAPDESPAAKLPSRSSI
jgi:16S rRNA processing protein RimM